MCAILLRGGVSDAQPVCRWWAWDSSHQMDEHELLFVNDHAQMYEHTGGNIDDYGEVDPSILSTAYLCLGNVPNSYWAMQYLLGPIREDETISITRSIPRASWPGRFGTKGKPPSICTGPSTGGCSSRSTSTTWEWIRNMVITISIRSTNARMVRHHYDNPNNPEVIIELDPATTKYLDTAVVEGATYGYRLEVQLDDELVEWLPYSGSDWLTVTATGFRSVYPWLIQVAAAEKFYSNAGHYDPELVAEFEVAGLDLLMPVAVQWYDTVTNTTRQWVDVTNVVRNGQTVTATLDFQAIDPDYYAALALLRANGGALFRICVNRGLPGEDHLAVERSASDPRHRRLGEQPPLERLFPGVLPRPGPWGLSRIHRRGVRRTSSTGAPSALLGARGITVRRRHG